MRTPNGFICLNEAFQNPNNPSHSRPVEVVKRHFPTLPAASAPSANSINLEFKHSTIISEYSPLLLFTLASLLNLFQKKTYDSLLVEYLASISARPSCVHPIVLPLALLSLRVIFLSRFKNHHVIQNCHIVLIIPQKPLYM